MKRVISWGVMMMLCMLPAAHLAAQDPITLIIKEGITKVIKAVDLKIQRLQNKTVWLQNAQKTLENKMQELKLGEISEWVEKQRKLYADYYEELWKVKSVLVYYQRVKAIIQKQVQLVNEYKRAYALFKRDKHFTANEISYMGKVYAGILDESAKTLEQLYLIVQPFTTQMSDGQRLALIHSADDKLEQQLTDLRQFNNQQMGLSLQRSKDLAEIQIIKALYGLQ